MSNVGKSQRRTGRQGAVKLATGKAASTSGSRTQKPVVSDLTKASIAELVERIAAEQSSLDALKKSRARAHGSSKQNLWTGAATSLGASAAAGMVAVMAVPSASLFLPIGVAAVAGLAVAALVERGGSATEKMRGRFHRNQHSQTVK